VKRRLKSFLLLHSSITYLEKIRNGKLRLLSIIIYVFIYLFIFSTASFQGGSNQKEMKAISKL